MPGGARARAPPGLLNPVRRQVEQLKAENEQLKSGSGAAAPPVTKPKDTPEQAKLRAQIEEALKPLQQAQNKEAASKKHALPESLEKFTTLAEEPAIIEVAEPLQALEAAVARTFEERSQIAVASNERRFFFFFFCCCCCCFFAEVCAAGFP